MKGPDWIDSFITSGEFENSIEEFYDQLHERLTNELGSAVEAGLLINGLSSLQAYDMYLLWLKKSSEYHRYMTRHHRITFG